MCCSAEIEMNGNAERQPCAVKTLPYASVYDQRSAEAELEALWDTRELESVMKCFAVFLDVNPDGEECLRVITE